MADRPALREDCPLGGTDDRIRVHVHANSVGGVEPATSGVHSSVPPPTKKTYENMKIINLGKSFF